jgi:hypothetical protein
MEIMERGSYQPSNISQNFWKMRIQSKAIDRYNRKEEDTVQK